MVGTANPQLVFVHGIGGLRDAEAERQQWLRALATGVRAAGRAELVSALTQGWLADVRFADYSDLFNARGAQGGAPGGELDPSDEQVLSDLLKAMVDELAEQYPPDSGTRDARFIEQARHQLDAVSSDGRAQGVGESGRRLVAVTTTLLQLPGLRQGAQWAGGQAFALQLSQVARYLNRHGDRAALGAAIRSRVLEGLDPTRPLVVVSHSLGTVVAYEALHEYEGPVALWVTLGSPLALGGVVLQRLVPRPPSCPEGVGAWHNFWDRNDVVVGRPRLADWIAPSARGVKAQTAPVKSGGLWTHTATKYLEHAEVAGPIAEALLP
ncbi:hypothetical protein EJ357_47890 [Streptomyces cyaneochromogenes]|uniref:Alpha/beta hydrolase n=1 Tax=Streptomyces cyaneochromogenes TaxID=2496836 RepID=A0A3S9LZ25_9ACTN|nr:hypothetical protein [Streptomyces cyaneochromogenes]AZQ32080.1 hypothetical protein EJ357_00040 [Streptomyces cyaneochromogenes]AZQ40143.1 hypothetical protein EJ357_47890 [Streptomyces cyaneochromogenes]